LFGHTALLTVGSNFHDNQINVGLLHTKERNVLDLTTSAHAHVTNLAGYIQQGIELGQRLHVDAGFRFDYFRFDVDDRIDSSHSGLQALRVSSRTRMYRSLHRIGFLSRCTPATGEESPARMLAG